VVADKLEIGVQELQARLRHQHPSPTHVSLLETTHFGFCNCTTDAPIIPCYSVPFFISSTTTHAPCMSWLLSVIFKELKLYAEVISPFAAYNFLTIFKKIMTF
jgi:hypothetical protein